VHVENIEEKERKHRRERKGGESGGDCVRKGENRTGKEA
jgi:hypothetical protein